MAIESLTDEVSHVVTIAEPSSGLGVGEVDAVVRVVGAKRIPELLRGIQVVVVAHIQHAIAEHEHSWRFLPLQYLAAGSTSTSKEHEGEPKCSACTTASAFHG